MRKIILAICAVACVVAAPTLAGAGSYSASGTYVGSPSSAVSSLFAQFPGGGQGLADAVAQLLTGNPALADDVAFVATSSGNAVQQTAAGAGMSAAETALKAAGNSSGASRIGVAAQSSGNAILVAAASASGGNASGGLAADTFMPLGNPTTSGASTNCVSPNKPGGC
jgi:hypothetical protein